MFRHRSLVRGKRPIHFTPANRRKAMKAVRITLAVIVLVAVTFAAVAVTTVGTSQTASACNFGVDC